MVCDKARWGMGRCRREGTMRRVVDATDAAAVEEPPGGEVNENKNVE
jgi:hypothetical protein